MRVNFISDERGFLATYLMGLYILGCIIILAVVLGIGTNVRSNAQQAYSWFQEAADYSTHTALMDGVSTADDDSAQQVRGYFDDAFAVITQTTVAGNEYDPQPGSPFPKPIQVNSFTPESAGAALPNGNTANADGYWISLDMPILVGNVPLIGQQTVDVLMSYYAEL